MKTYYKIVCSREQEMAGAGLGYEEMFGDCERYFWCQRAAELQAEKLNGSYEPQEEAPSYGVEERRFYDDESFDDECDGHAAEQLGLLDCPP